MIKLGKIVAVHGLQGAVVLKHNIQETDWLNKDDVLHIELQRDSLIPHFVEQVKGAKAGECIVMLDDLNDADKAKRLIGKNVYADEEMLRNTNVDSPLLYVGFNLVDKSKGSLGEITNVMQAGPQWIAQIMVEGKEVLIPLADDFILDVNMKNKFIRMDLPDGLLEVYLDNSSETE